MEETTMETEASETTMTKRKSAREVNRLSAIQKQKLKLVVMENSEKFGGASARCKVNDKELAKLITAAVGTKVSYCTANHWRNRYKVAPARNRVHAKKIKKTRGYNRTGVSTSGSIEHVVAMNTAKILKVLKKIAKRMHVA